MHRLELLIPPPIIMLMTGLIMWLLSKLLPTLSVSWSGSLAAGAIIALAGLIISLAGVSAFKRASTTADPRHPAQTSTLVTTGVYRYTRNPMYLGVLLILFGWAVFLGNALSALCLLIFIAYITWFQILPEERQLQDKFGTDFLLYKREVRRWI